MSLRPKITVKRLSAPATVVPSLVQPKQSAPKRLPPSMFPLYDLRQGAGLATVIHQNGNIVAMLDRLIDHCKAVKASAPADEKKKHGFRISSFVKARDALKDWDQPILSGDQAKRDIKGIGKGVAERIDEFIKTGKLAELDTVSSDPRTRAIMDLTSITGIGEKRATTLVDEFGVTSVEDLVSKINKGSIGVGKNQLTAHIAVGIKYYHDLQERIPWAEVHQIKGILTDLVTHFNPTLMVSVCGSYRRQKQTCGDIDVLICDPQLLTDADAERSSPLEQLVKELTKNNFLVGHLTEHGKTKYMGVCQSVPGGTGMRIDIRFVSRAAWAPAVLYFTGSGKFNKLMRYKANERGYTISEYGIYRYVNGVKGDQIIVDTEEDIFKVLNCVYLAPTEREF